MHTHVRSPREPWSPLLEGVERAHKTVSSVRSAWVQDREVTGDHKDEIAEYWVLMKVTFLLKG